MKIDPLALTFGEAHALRRALGRALDRDEIVPGDRRAWLRLLARLDETLAKPEKESP